MVWLLNHITLDSIKVWNICLNEPYKKPNLIVFIISGDIIPNVKFSVGHPVHKYIAAILCMRALVAVQHWRPPCTDYMVQIICVLPRVSTVLYYCYYITRGYASKQTSCSRVLRPKSAARTLYLLQKYRKQKLLACSIHNFIWTTVVSIQQFIGHV